MRRYVSGQARFAYVEDDGVPTEYGSDGSTVVVHASDGFRVCTGLFDPYGVEIMRVEAPEPVGFHLNRWASLGNGS